MTLRQGATKGMWQSHAATGKAGVHALIIGVSAYPHLDDGTGAIATQTGGMGQLEMCARTAALVFDWLKRTGRVAGAPVASCRLHIAPRPTEVAHVSTLTSDWYGETDYVSLRTAVEAWGNDLAAGGREAEPTVAYLFFSGHGMDHLGHPTLLADDILNPAQNQSEHNAIAFMSLWLSIATYGVDRALFFVDACRNAPQVARNFNIVGQDILKPAAYPGKAPEAILWLQSTQRGAFSYQIKGRDKTIFGEALLDGLEGLPPDHLPYDKQAHPWRLIFDALEAHVRHRVVALLAQYSATAVQIIDPGGSPYRGSTLVAEKTPVVGISGTIAPTPPPAEPIGPSVPTPPDAGSPIDIVSLPPDAGGQFPPTGLDAATRHLLDTRSDVTLRPFTQASSATVELIKKARQPPLGTSRRAGDLEDPSLMHEILGHEGATDPWIETLKVLDVWSGRQLPEETVIVTGAHRHEANDHRMTVWIDLQVQSGLGTAAWIQSGGFRGSANFAVAIPRDKHEPMPVRLDLALRRVPQQREWLLESMTARIGPPDALPQLSRDIWSGLWQVQRAELLLGLSTAGLAAKELGVLRDAVFGKVQSPVAAAIAAALLLRAGADESLNDWPKNLADWFPRLADGPILWCQTLINFVDRVRTPHPSTSELHARQAVAGALDHRDAMDEARTYFAELIKRGPPLLTPVLAMAAQQAVILRSRVNSGQPDAQLDAAAMVVDGATRFAISGSLFSAFVFTDADMTPRQILQSGSQAAPATAG